MSEQLEKKRQELHKLIDQGAPYEVILEASQQLDKLVVISQRCLNAAEHIKAAAANE